MSFKIKVNDAVFEWENNQLTCTKESTMLLFKDLLSIHEPKVVTMPDGIDYDDDLTDERNAYSALLGTFPESKIIKDLSEETEVENIVY